MSRRIAWFTAVAIALAAFLRGPSAASAQQSVKLGAGDTLTISGFINATLFNNRGYFDFGQGQLALLKGSGLAVTNGIGSGEASGKPQFEARFNLAKRFGTSSWNGYVVYHVDNKDMNGVGVPGGALNGWGVETGHNFTSGKLTVHGNY